MCALKKTEMDPRWAAMDEHQRMRCVLSNLRRFVTLRMVQPATAEQLIAKIEEPMGEDYRGRLLAAVDEQIAIVKNSEDNRCGYHLNCIHSGKTVYSVVPYFYGNEEEAEDNNLESLDFDSEEEAEAAAKEYKHADIISFDPDELWAVLNKNNKNELKTVYRNSHDALAALYELAKPSAFMEYMSGKPIIGVSVNDDKEEEKDNA